MLTAVRHLAANLFAALMLVSLAGPAMAALPAFDLTTISQAETDLGVLINDERITAGLVELQVDPDAMAIARRRAETMAATDVLSHQNPDGTNVFDDIAAAGIPWFGAGEVIVWNNFPTALDSTSHAVTAWMGSPSHRSIVMSGDYNYAGFGAAVSPTSGNRYYAGVFLKRTDRTAAWARVDTTASQVIDATHTQVTVRWTGGDPRLQVLTAGLRDYEVQRHVVGGTWRVLGYRTTTSVTETLPSARTYEYRIRARDKAGNVGLWALITVRV